MLIHTLPGFVQSRILTFLAVENERFCRRELVGLARDVLAADGEVDFWVERAARNLLDVLSDSNHRSVAVDEEFDSLPGWLKNSINYQKDLVLHWLPISPDEFSSEKVSYEDEIDDNSLSEVGESVEEDFSEVMKKLDIEMNVNIERHIEEMAVDLRARLMNFESSLKTAGLADEMRELCLEKGADPLVVLGLIEPWKMDDETASVLVTHFSSASEDELTWPSQVLCSVVLSKLLVLEEPASRVLLTATVEYCKNHQRAAVYAILLPLILRREGINKVMCDFITKILKESLHPAHVSAFFQKLFCGGEDERRFICLPCHRSLISDKLVWTESFFALLQNILDHNIQLTVDAVNHIVNRVPNLAEMYPKSLKFGNFLLCLVTKCGSLLKSHKVLLIQTVGNTNTIVTKSILSKLTTI